MKKQLIDCLKIGDKVFDIIDGWGEVSSIKLNTYEEAIVVKFKDGRKTYCSDGKWRDSNDTNPSLFLHEIKLEQELPEFVEGEIVLAETNPEGFINIDTYWTVAKYVSYKYGRYKVKPYFKDSFADWEIDSLKIKSFDKSHFTK